MKKQTPKPKPYIFIHTKVEGGSHGIIIRKPVVKKEAQNG